MNEKFTPGPWWVEIGEGDDDYGTAYVCHKRTECPDTTICAFDGEDKFDAPNAHLIAAAPEMYEALDKISRRIQSGTLDEWSWQALVDLAERNLKKARGES